MVTTIYLKSDEGVPPEGPYVLIEHDPDGSYYGVGRGAHGQIYVSFPEDEVDLDRALAAAHKWAQENGVTTVHVQMVVDGWT